MEIPFVQRSKWVSSPVTFLIKRGKQEKVIEEIDEVFRKVIELNNKQRKKKNIEQDESNKLCEQVQSMKQNEIYLVNTKELLTQDKKKYTHDTGRLRKENSELKATLKCLQNEISAKYEETRTLEEECIYSKMKIEKLEMQLATKTKQIVMLQVELNEGSKLLDEERNRCKTMKSALNEYAEKLVDASRLSADNDMLYKSLENERKQSERAEVSLLKEIEILEEKLEKAQQDILDHQVQMATINKISEESCAKYIRNCSLPDRANIEKEFSRTKAQEERIAKETANILTRYASKKDSMETLIDRFEKYDYKQQRPLKTCEESSVNIYTEGLSCSEESLIKNVEKEMLSIEGQDCHKIEHLNPQKQISQTIVQADKVFFVNSAVSNNITESETKAIKESF